MKDKFGVIDRVIKALESFTVSYAIVIIVYVLISDLGVFSPIDNEMAVRLMYICLVIAVVHFVMGFFDIKSEGMIFLLSFGAVAAVVFFMGSVVFDFFRMDIVFFACLAAMLVVVFVGTYLITYLHDWKKVQEINDIIRKNKK